MPKKPQVKIKAVYGKPMSKAAGQKISLNAQQVSRAAKIILDELKKEIKKEMAKVATRRPGEPVPIPDSKRFLNSWKVRVRGKSTIEITSNWPTAAAHTVEKKSGPYEMTWLSRPSVPYAKLALKDGQVIVRTTPLSGKQKMWIHPGFKKYGFLNRGINKGRLAAIQALAVELLQKALDEELDLG